jgi:hypothetical protein
MDLGELQTSVGNQISGSILTLGMAVFEPPAVKSAILMATGTRNLQIAQAGTPTVANSQVVVTGVISWWGIAAPAEARFSLNGGVPALTLFVRPQVIDWTFATTFPQLADTLVLQRRGARGATLINDIKLGSPEFIICSDAYTDADTGIDLFPGLNLKADILLTGPLALLAPHRTATTPLKAIGPITMAPGSATTGTLEMPSDIRLNVPIGAMNVLTLPFSDSFALLDFSTMTYVDRLTGEESLEGKTSALFCGRTSIGSKKDIDVVVTLADSEQGWTRVEFLIDDDLPSLQDLVTVSGSAAAQIVPADLAKGVVELTRLQLTMVDTHLAMVDFTIQASLAGGAGWPFLPAVSDKLVLEDIVLDCALTEPLSTTAWDRRLSARLAADLMLGSAKLQVGIEWPSKRVIAVLVEGAPQVADIVAEFNPGATRLPHLAADYIGFTTDLDGSFFTFEVSTSETWSLEVAGETLAIADLAARISKTKGSGSFDLEIEGFIVIGEAEFLLRAQHPESGSGWSFEGEQSSNVPLNLRAMVDGLLKLGNLSLPAPVPEFTISNLSIQAVLDGTGKLTSLGIQGSADAKTTLPIGNTSYALDATVDILLKRDDDTGHHVFTGYVDATLAVGTTGAAFNVSYRMGQDDHVFQAYYDAGAGPSLDLLAIAELLNLPHGIQPPSGLDLGLQRASFQYNVETESFLLSAQSKSYKSEAFFVAEKQNGAWGFVAGLDLDLSHIDSKTPIIGSAWSDISGLVHLQEVAFVLSSTDFQPTATSKGFTLPTLPALTPPPQGIKVAGVKARQQVAAGVVVGANAITPAIGSATLSLTKDSITVALKADLKKSPKDAVKRAADLVPESELVLQLAVDPSGFTLQAYLVGSATIRSKDGGGMAFEQPVLILAVAKGAGLLVKLQGTMRLHLNSETFIATGRLAIDADEMEGSLTVTMDPGQSFTLPVAKGVHFDSFGLEAGVVFEPPGFDFGLQGQLYIGPAPPTLPGDFDKFAFVLELVEEVPNPRLLSFALKEIDIPTAFAAVGEQAPSGFNPIKATDVSFYWAESAVLLPDGSLSQPGVGFNGSIDILGFKAHASLKVDSSGIVGDAEMDPIHIGNVISITGNGQGVHVLEVKDPATGQWQRQPSQITKPGPAPETRQTTLITPGGPQVHFSTISSPYLSASWKVTLFGALSEELQVDVTSQGATFHLRYVIEDFLHAALDCTLDSKGGFQVHGHLDIGVDAHIGPIIVPLIDVNLGTIHLVAKLDTDIILSVTPDQFYCSLEAEFDFEGLRLTIPKLEIKIPFASLKDLPGILIEQIGREAGEIFKALVEDVGEVLEQGAKEVVALAEQAGEEVVELGQAAAQEAVKLVGEAEAAVDKVETEIKQTADAIGNDVVAFGKETEQLVANIGQEAKQAVKAVEQEAEKIVSEVAAEVTKVAAAVEHEVVEIGQDIERVAKEAEQEVEHLAQEAAAFASQVLREAEQAFNALIADARAVVDAIEQAAEKLWNEVEDLAEEAGRAVVGAAKTVWNAVRQY